MSLTKSWEEKDIANATQLLNSLSLSISMSWMDSPGNPLEALGSTANRLEKEILPHITDHPTLTEQLAETIQILRENDDVRTDPGFKPLNKVQSTITSIFKELPTLNNRQTTVQQHVEKQMTFQRA